MTWIGRGRRRAQNIDHKSRARSMLGKSRVERSFFPSFLPPPLLLLFNLVNAACQPTTTTIFMFWRTQSTFNLQTDDFFIRCLYKDTQMRKFWYGLLQAFSILPYPRSLTIRFRCKGCQPAIDDDREASEPFGITSTAIQKQLPSILQHIDDRNIIPVQNNYSIKRGTVCGFSGANIIKLNYPQRPC